MDRGQSGGEEVDRAFAGRLHPNKRRSAPMFAVAALAAGAVGAAWAGGGLSVMPEQESSGAATVAAAADPLAEVEAMVRRQYPAVAEIGPSDIAVAPAEDVILFDVREADEFAVSHLPGAVQVDPGVWTSSFVERYGEMVQGKRVVFYCSVGVRSSKLAQRVGQRLRSAGAKGVYNLTGGVFRWHNEERPLQSSGLPTDLVHKYDEHWGLLVARQDLAVTRMPEGDRR